MPVRSIVKILSILLITLSMCPETFGWAHQGHILMTRLAVLRIIDDPKTPAGLRDFLKSQMHFTLADCLKLATAETVGLHPEKTGFDAGVDHWCTMPDQIRFLPEGREKIEPYGQIESPMHFLDLEAFSSAFVYRDDLSSKPAIDAIPHDLHDPRFKVAGYVPWRVEEFYRRLMADFGSGETIDRGDLALRDMGYLCHYIEDSTQPHHATVDYQSITYLAGHVPGIFATTRPGSGTLARMHLPKGIDPHGDVEFQLFENANAPRAEFRKEYWEAMEGDIAEMGQEETAIAGTKAGKNFDPFRWDVGILLNSYDALPFIGHAAQTAYATGTFDAEAFFSFKGNVYGKEMNVVELIALQNAKGVLETERAIRLAWEEGHSPVGR